MFDWTVNAQGYDPSVGSLNYKTIRAIIAYDDPKTGTCNIANYSPLFNGLILVVCKIIKIITSSTTETEFGTVFTNAKEVTPIRTTLEEMG
mmetsp:Transcript_18618/g.17928  ORF Transcript_18618/g.17928 Transcript_18618/m.17928 type:complete len:91 (-) Transcript_18618:218-490(-)